MKKCIGKFLIALLILSLNSCGVITKTRYGNGLKINLWENKGRPDAQANKQSTLLNTKRIKIKPIETTLAKPMSLSAECVDIPALHQSLETDRAREKTKIKAKSRLKRMAKQLLTKPKQQGYPMEAVNMPMEPNVRIAAWMFYGSMLLSVFLAATEVLFPYLGIFTLIGFIMAIVGLSNIRRSGGAYRGSGLAISIIVLFTIGILFYIFLFLLLFALFI